MKLLVISTKYSKLLTTVEISALKVHVLTKRNQPIPVEFRGCFPHSGYN